MAAVDGQSRRHRRFASLNLTTARSAGSLLRRQRERQAAGTPPGAIGVTDGRLEGGMRSPLDSRAVGGQRGPTEGQQCEEQLVLNPVSEIPSAAPPLPLPPYHVYKL
ncbi:hypothetical protein AAFF_G00096220 [Aldrovandia affinis]|uniref:Uncharacterized protein n=1 Tax=Aldrovandia affinis TaxID=143900 RepID=A0AAD7RVP3_9TELE|nr:hypothetical protein AAFF_G00096220 [Aldrovandia affinis]